VKLGMERVGAKPADFIDYGNQNRVFEDMGAFRNQDFNLTGGSEAEHITGARITPNLFPLLGATILKGRVFAPREGQSGESDVVILSQGLWQRRFGFGQETRRLPNVRRWRGLARLGRFFHFEVFTLAGFGNDLDVIGDFVKIRGVQETGLFHADLDKRGLHPWQDPRNFAFIDIAGDAHLLFAFDQKISQQAIFNDGNTAFLGRRINENFLFHKKSGNLVYEAKAGEDK
jgi:hypothetical protein